MISVLYNIILITNFKLIEMCRKSSPLGRAGVGFLKHSARKPSQKDLHDEDKSLPPLMLLMPRLKIISLCCRLYYYVYS